MQKPAKAMPSEPVKEEFLTILQNADKAVIIPFLKNLTTEEKRKLVPVIKEETKKYYFWGNRQYELEKWEIESMLCAARFVCSTASEVKRTDWWVLLPHIDTIEQILEWYQPEWLLDFIDEEIDVFFDLNYNRLLYWKQRGWINPSIESFVTNRLPAALEVRTSDLGYLYITEPLEQYPVTLDEHIWYLFYYSSSIVWIDGKYTGSSGKGCWCTIFKKYTDEGRLDRMRVLRESLLAVNRNFPKMLTGWFSTLFLSLEPTPDELFELREELFATLTCVHTKPINATLTLFRKIAKDKRFPVADFVPHLPSLLSAEVKSIVVSALAVIEILLKQKAGNPEELCSAVCTAFLSKDEAVQKKAATIIARYAEPGGGVSDVLSSFSDNILMSVKPLLQAYLVDNQPETESAETTASDDDQLSGFLPLIREDNRIPAPETFEDFAFSLSNLLNIGESYYFDLLLSNISVWGSRTDEENLILLEAVFQKAFNGIIKNSVKVLSDMPLLFVIHYYEYLQKKFSGKLGNIAKIKQQAEDTDKEYDENSSFYNRRLIPFNKLEVPDHLTGYKNIALAALDKMQQSNPLPLLSTPTHLPAWIDPVVLVTKLIQYQQRGETPDDMDLQLAVQRCALRGTEEALALAGEQLTGELRNLMLFLFDENRLPQGEFVHPAWWMTAGITRSPGIAFKEFESFPYNKNLVTYFSDNIGWETSMEDYMERGEYNRGTGSYEHYPSTRIALKIIVPERKLRESANTPGLGKGSDYLFLEYLMCVKYVEHAGFLLAAIPNTPDAFYAFAIWHLATCGGILYYLSQQQLSLAVVKNMHELETPFREMHYLLLVCCLMNNQKPSKDYALDIWINRVSTGTIDNARLGTAIGKYVCKEFVPLKRFTDLLASSMMGISARHNRAALELVEAMLRQLNPEPIKNLKKLLEIYKELLALNSAKADFEGIKQLDAWVKTDNLKKVIKQIKEA